MLDGTGRRPPSTRDRVAEELQWRLFKVGDRCGDVGGRSRRR